MTMIATLTTPNPNSALKNISQDEEDPRVLAMSYMMYKIGKIIEFYLFQIKDLI